MNDALAALLKTGKVRLGKTVIEKKTSWPSKTKAKLFEEGRDWETPPEQQARKSRANPLGAWEVIGSRHIIVLGERDCE